ncbi:MAG: pantetheine-phosphate adenylyltransferase [Planctomycetes bacterium]|nr:pantetheine-phosphate adenylyltransferase [Planctomycetota bacterium]
MSRKLSNRVAVYTGVFDPIHLGHLDVIQRGSRIFDRLVVGVGTNPDKAPFFTPEERVHLVEQVVTELSNVEVRSFSGLAVGFVRKEGAGVMLRGLRTTSDMEYEFTMSLMNRNLDPDIETVFLMAEAEYSHLSSTMIRQIASLGGALERFLPPVIKEALERRVRELQQGASK